MTDKKYNEIKEKLKEYAEVSDREVAHREADWILCELLTELGYKEIVEIYHKIGKWYA